MGGTLYRVAKVWVRVDSLDTHRLRTSEPHTEYGVAWTITLDKDSLVLGLKDLSILHLLYYPILVL
jgi:hypothetical protein